MPLQIAALPKDERGYPIPFFAPYADGKPVFALADGRKREICVLEKLCWICGQRLFDTFAFVGGPLSLKSRTFGDAPMHVDCAEYAVQICPWLADPDYKKRMQKGGDEFRGHVAERPEVVYVLVTQNYTLLGRFDNFVFKASDPVEVQTWKHGVKQT